MFVSQKFLMQVLDYFYNSQLHQPSYQDKNLFMNNQIKLISNNFLTKDYKQLWGEFTEGLSIVDACFNLTKEEVIKLL